MICNICRSELATGSPVCPNCGHVMPQIGVVSVPTYIPKEERKKYCENCGSEIDNRTEKCTVCGKSSKKSSKSFIAIPILSILLAISIVLGIVLAVSYSNAVDERDRWQRIYSQIKGDEAKLNFYNENIVFISDWESNVYHTYDCPLFESYVWVGDKSAPIEEGYTACADCH